MQFQRRLGDIETIMGLKADRGGIAPDDVQRDLMDVVITWNRPVGTVVLIPIQDDYIDVGLYATPNSDISVSDHMGDIGIQRMPDGQWVATESKRRKLQPGTPAYKVNAGGCVIPVGLATTVLLAIVMFYV